jgi:hypothetical protein
MSIFPLCCECGDVATAALLYSDGDDGDEKLFCSAHLFSPAAKEKMPAPAPDVAGAV